MATNNTKNPLVTVPSNSKSQPQYSQVAKTPNGTTIAVNASETGEGPVLTNYPHH